MALVAWQVAVDDNSFTDFKIREQYVDNRRKIMDEIKSRVSEFDGDYAWSYSGDSILFLVNNDSDRKIIKNAVDEVYRRLGVHRKNARTGSGNIAVRI